MNDTAEPSSPVSTGAPTIGFREFVGLIACLMAVTALGIDTMLPSLPMIARSVGIVRPNEQQWIVAIYMIGFGFGQLLHGPLGDRFGRRPILLAGLSVYVLACFGCALATSPGLLFAARLVQGLGAAAARVLSVSVVRDCYGGRQMARVMSLAFVVFLAVPVIAPSLGSLILVVGSWRLIFVLLAGFALFVGMFLGLRLPETLPPTLRQPIAIAGLRRAASRVLIDRMSCGYTLAATLLFGALIGFLNTAQQIFADTFGSPSLFAPLFGSCAATMAVASLLNARIVERVGTRRVSQGALCVYIAVAAVHLAVVVSGYESLPAFAVLQAATMGCFALAAANFNAMAMDPLGDIAGTASAIQGTLSTVGGAAIGLVIGQSYDGTTRSLVTGTLLCGVATFAVVLLAERGRLFQPHTGRGPVALFD